MQIEDLWPIAAAVFLFAGTIKGLVGIGLPTAVLGLLAQFTDPRNAIALMLLPMLISNAFQAYKNGMVRRSATLFWPFALCMIAGILVFTHFVARFSSGHLTAIVGTVIVLFVVVNVFVKPLAIPDHLDKAVQVALGSLAGIMGGLTSLWAPPLVVYLLSKRLPKDEFVGALGFLLLAGSLPLLLGYWQAGLATPQLLAYSLAMTIPTLLGVAIGEQGRRFLSGDQFRQLLLFVFFLLGLNLIRSAIF